MRSLSEVRADFDEVDAALLPLLRRRLELAKEAGAIKRGQGLAVADPVREEHSRQQRAAWCSHGGVDVDVVERLFAVLIEASRDAQR